MLRSCLWSGCVCPPEDEGHEIWAFGQDDPIDPSSKGPKVLVIVRVTRYMGNDGT